MAALVAVSSMGAFEGPTVKILTRKGLPRPPKKMGVGKRGWK